ncbi:MAG: CBS domain-containing protein [Acidimicrobiia bacterium]
MPATTLVRDVMTTDVLTFRADQSVADAVQHLVDRGVDGAPVIDGAGVVVGVLSSDDLIVQQSQLHLPTIVSIFGATLELPGSARKFDIEIHKALGNTVGEVMSKDPVTCSPDDSVSEAATIMHRNRVSRLPVVEAGRLVGIIGRGDVLRVIAGAR